MHFLVAIDYFKNLLCFELQLKFIRDIRNARVISLTVMLYLEINIYSYGLQAAKRLKTTVVFSSEHKNIGGKECMMLDTEIK